MLLHEGDSLLKVVKKVFVIFLVIIGQFYNIIHSNVIARGRQSWNYNIKTYFRREHSTLT